MKNVSNRELAVALYEATRNCTGKDLEQVIINFVELLAHKGKLYKAEAIIKEFVAYAEKKEGLVNIEITTARALDAETLEHIKRAFGEKVRAVEKIQPDILGGMIVRTDNEILDASVRTQLQTLKARLI